MKKRVDVLLYENGYAVSREKAKAMVMAGCVYIGEKKVDKPGIMVESTTEFFVRDNTSQFVGRGGEKLLKAINAYSINLNGRICADIGASTGGFTDCMLQNGAVKVYAIDVGYGQLDYKLRCDERVVSMEKTNARHLDENSLQEPMDFISIDVSFISLKLIIPVLDKIMKKDGEVVALIKPQFEAGKEQVGKKGIIRDRNVHEDVLKNITDFIINSGFCILGLTFSPITGANGNIEFLVYFKHYNETSHKLNIDFDSILDEAYSFFRSKYD